MEKNMIKVNMKKHDGGKIRLWEVQTSHDPRTDIASVIVRYGQKGGKTTERIKPIRKGKNIGKKNETTTAEQARLEALSKARAQMDQNYVLSDPSQVAGFTGFERNGIKVFLPMLAQKYDEKYLKAEGVYIQPKLDGFRMVARLVNGAVEMTTRKGKLIDTMTEIKEHLSVIFKDDPDIVLDGEIYKHGWTFQRIASAIKKRRKDTESLEFHIFDSVSNKSFAERYIDVKNAINDRPGPCVPVGTLELPKTKIKDSLEVAHQRYIGNGYEGTMIRVGDCAYREDKRSRQLLKKKDFMDAEFIIVGGSEELLQDGNMGVIYSVEDPENKNVKFDVRPRGDMASRTEKLKNLAIDIGKKLTVRYQELSEDLIPRFPVGLHIRELD